MFTPRTVSQLNMLISVYRLNHCRAEDFDFAIYHFSVAACCSAENFAFIYNSTVAGQWANNCNFTILPAPRKGIWQDTQSNYLSW